MTSLLCALTYLSLTEILHCIYSYYSNLSERKLKFSQLKYSAKVTELLNGKNLKVPRLTWKAPVLNTLYFPACIYNHSNL